MANTKIMYHLVGKNDAHAGDAFVFMDKGEDPKENEDYKMFLENDFELLGVFELELIEGVENLPGDISSR
jgi:hypothetical protein